MVRGVECTEPTAYITDGTDLFQVVGPGDKDKTVLEDCLTGAWSEVSTWRLRSAPWYLVRAAVGSDWEAGVAAG